MMAEGLWNAGPSHLAKADEWGVTVHAVEKVATAASRVLKHILATDMDTIKAVHLTAIEDIRRKAMEGWQTEPRLLKTALDALELSLKVNGLMGPKVVKHIGPDAADLAKMTIEEHRRRLREISDEIELELAEAEQGGSLQ